MNLTGKVALITGASKGIGRAIALELANNGAAIAVNYNVDAFGADETINLIKEKNGYAKSFKCDVKSYSASKNLVDAVINHFGKIDILINNAGVSKVSLFIDMDESGWDNIIDTNLKGVFNVTHNALKYMVKQRKGNIINISSIWGKNGASCEAIYSASKGGINAFTQSLAKELGSLNIRVNAVAPGVINTSMNNWLEEEEITDLIEDIPLGRFGEKEDVTKLVAFLCSEDSNYITGQIIVIDGGML